jgi:signal transduction histidine kinase
LLAGDYCVPKHQRNSGQDSSDLRVLLELLPAVALVEDVESDRLVAINVRAIDLFRMPRERLLSSSFVSLSAAVEGSAGQAPAAISKHIDAAVLGRSFVGRWVFRDALGGEIPCELRLFRVPGAATLVCGIVVDSPESEDVHERLRRAREQLREATSLRHESVEAERARLSRELHDQLGQLMTAAKINIAMIVRSIEKLPSRNSLRPELLERAAVTTDVIDQMLDRARNMAAELRPEGLDTLGLPAVIETELGAFVVRTGIQARSKLDPKSASLPRKVSAVLLRCMKELLTNVARHARATSVEVRLTYSKGSVTLEVCDDGIGMPETARGGSLGIVGIEERVAELEGTLRFAVPALDAGKPGTAAIIEIPLARST